ncbi:stalk domain-containing protein [Zhenhengia yiwuensis]|uniref:stalk domain-containing protein n=1 Tax=Zhenhengia yiwuensis TaxID=2763666 RepID=UPI002A754BDE|nr:stalk domain-containing protein [Zhenhengia yiwuensis]MDY3368522.1 stalk domain-containing protein [Zhenhengia yiwuensis]
MKSKSKALRKMLCGLLVTSSVLSMATPVFAQHPSDKDGDGKIGKVTLYKTENVQSDNSGDYLLEIKLEEGWTPYADVQITVSQGSLCTSLDKGYMEIDGTNEYVLEGVVGATLRDVNNGGTRFRGKLTNPKQGGIIEVPLNLCQEHGRGGLVGQAGLKVTIHKDNSKFFANGSVNFDQAKPISERGNEPTQPNKVYKEDVRFTIGKSTYTITTKEGKQITKSMQNGEAPFMSNGRTMIPVRYAGEALNASVEWNPAVKEVIVKKDGVTVRLPLNSQYAIYSDGSKVDMGAKTVQKNGRTYVPVGALGNMLDTPVTWDDVTQTAIFSK